MRRPRSESEDSVSAVADGGHGTNGGCGCETGTQIRFTRRSTERGKPVGKRGRLLDPGVSRYREEALGCRQIRHDHRPSVGTADRFWATRPVEWEAES
jgi:hypothetical protein